MSYPTFTLFQIVYLAYTELGLNAPAVVTTSTDLQVKQLWQLINRDLQQLILDKDWTVLQKEYDLHVGQPITTTGDTTLNAYTITNIPTTAGIQPFNWVCNAGNIPVAARVVSVDSSTQVTLSEPATGTEVGVSCVFAQDTYPEPDDFGRFINQTWWDRTNRWALLGPDSPQVDQWHRSGVVTIGPRRHFRQIGPQLPYSYTGDFSGTDFSNTDFNVGGSGGIRYNYRLWPPPAALDTPINIAFEYISNWPVISPTNNFVNQNRFLADTDFAVVSGDALVLGAKWRLWQIKGFDYRPLQQEYLDFVEQLYGADGGNKTLSLAPLRQNMFITSSNVQDGSFPGPLGPNAS
jgi:hypothetical protein